MGKGGSLLLLLCPKPLAGFPGGSVVENPPANAGEVSLGFDSKVRKSPWKRKQQPTPVFFPGESHGQRSLVESRGLQSWKRLKQLLVASGWG